MRICLIILAGYFLATALYIWFMPHAFYEGTPGLAAMGPFNMHFIRDVALTFLVSGGAMLWGALRRNKVALICGAAWPFLHALFHIQIWGHRGFPFDDIWAFDLAAVVLPGLIGLALAVKFKAP